MFVRHHIIALCGLVVALTASDPLHAQNQGFMVKPIRLEVVASPGQTLELPVQVRNIAGVGSIPVDLRLVELSQNSDGTWRLIEPEGNASPNSHREWSSLSTDRVTVAPQQPAELVAQVRVPISAMGVYFAGLVAETPVPENSGGVLVRVRFLIPIIVHVQGRPVRQSVTLSHASMDYVAERGYAPTTAAHLHIENAGRTFSRVRGTLRIEREQDGRWRPVTVIETPERSIVPGVTLELGSDLGRRLPSGTYRLRGELQVDGRRVSSLERVVDFEGDPTIDAVAYDTTLSLSPEVVDLDVAPGAARTTIVRVENPGEDSIDVEMTARTPPSLLGVEMEGLSGVELSAAEWTEVRPSTFTIGPGRWQNVRLVTQFPRNGVQHPHYYADLILTGKYADGQSAGETRSTIHLENRAGHTKVDGAIDLVQITEASETSEFVLQLRLANLGNVDVRPFVRAILADARGVALESVVLSGDEAPLLPLGQRTYSGDLPLADIPLGYYSLILTAALAPEAEVTRTQLVLVEQKDGNRILSVLDGTEPPPSAQPEAGLDGGDEE